MLLKFLYCSASSSCILLTFFATLYLVFVTTVYFYFFCNYIEANVYRPIM